MPLIGSTSTKGAGLEISVKLDMKEVDRMLKTTKRVRSQAAASALNDALRSARSEATRSMAKELKVKQKYLKRFFLINRASRSKLYGRLSVRPAGIPLEWIGGSQRKTGFKPRGMNVRKHTFEATMKSGHKGVYLRSSKGLIGKGRGGRPGDYRKAPSGRARRLPLETAFAGNTTKAFLKQHVYSAVERRAREQFIKRYTYHAKRLMARNGVGR